MNRKQRQSAGTLQTSLLVTAPPEYDERPSSPLCHPQGEMLPPVTPRSWFSSRNSDADGQKSGKNTPRSADEKRRSHNRFFSLSVLKPLKITTPFSPRKSPSSNPASPMNSRRLSASGTPPDLRVSSMTLEQVVRDPELSGMFMSFLERKNATEGLEFLMRLEAMKTHETIPDIDTYSLHEEALILYEFYIREGAQYELNLSSCTREEVETKLTAPKAEQLKQPSAIFQEARIEVYNMLGTDMYSQWIASLNK